MICTMSPYPERHRCWLDQYNLMLQPALEELSKPWPLNPVRINEEEKGKHNLLIFLVGFCSMLISHLPTDF